MGPEGVITFSVVHEPGKPDEGAEEQVAIGMTAGNLKAFLYTANRIIEHFEKLTGVEIPIGEDVVRATDKAIASSTVQKK